MYVACEYFKFFCKVITASFPDHSVKDFQAAIENI